MKYLLFIFLIINVLFGQEKKTVQVTGSCLVVNISPEQAKKIALDNARAEAIKSAFGLNISEEIFSSFNEVKNNDKIEEFNENFNKIIHTATNGKIIDEKVQFETKVENGNVIIYANLEATVIEEIGNSDPDFKVEIILPKTKFYVNEDTNKSDNLDFKLWSSEDCYLYLFNVMHNDTITILLPNELIKDNSYKIQKKVQNYEKYFNNVKFTVGLPKDKDYVIEGLLLIAIKEKINFIPNVLETEKNGNLITYNTRLTNLMKWLVKIPLNQRAEIFKTIEIIRKNNHLAN